MVEAVVVDVSPLTGAEEEAVEETEVSLVEVAEAVGAVEVVELALACAEVSVGLLDVAASEGVLDAFGSYTITVREAVPVFPAWSVAEYVIVCSPAALVSMIT